MEVLTVKLDASEAIAVIGKAIGPGAVLLPQETVRKLLEQCSPLDIETLVRWGAIVGTGADEAAK